MTSTNASIGGVWCDDCGRARGEEDNESAKTGTEGKMEAMHDAIWGCVERMSEGIVVEEEGGTTNGLHSSCLSLAANC